VTGAERAIRWSTVAAVSIVAGVAGTVSYEHAYQVVRAHGEAGIVARLYPATIDGLVYAASMALLDAARRKRAAPRLARWLLGAGIGATLAANVAAGIAYGPLGAVVAAWPAGALVGSYELLMVIIRGSAAGQDEPPAGHHVPQAPADVAAAARLAYTTSVTLGSPLSQRAIADRFGLSRRKAAQLMTEAAASTNGHGPPG
jgi:Protein of unknown function (DUF2637)